MIDNFDELVARCSARNRRRMIRLSLRISAAILLLLASIAGYEMWSSPPAAKIVQKADSVPQTPAPQPVRVQTTAAPAPVEAPPSQPSEEPKKRAYVLQLTSSKSYGSVAAILPKIPPKYRSGMAIYSINNYYVLRYIDIYDKQSVQPLIKAFKAMGFDSLTVFKYNPERIPITEKDAASIAALSTPLPLEGDHPQLPSVAPAPLPSAGNPSTSHLFKVNTEPKDTGLTPTAAFDANPKYETALAAARDFYGKNDFANAAIWAKKANQLNREAEEAWLLYAKSYYAQGRKNDAIGVLELYLNYKDSKAAAQLLQTWKQKSAN